MEKLAFDLHARRHAASSRARPRVPRGSPLRGSLVVAPQLGLKLGKAKFLQTARRGGCCPPLSVQMTAPARVQVSGA
jgi:hypothetical protein